MSKSQERRERGPAEETTARGPAEVGAHNFPLLEAWYRDFASDPASVPADWRRFFESFPGNSQHGPQRGPSFRPSSIFNPPPLDGRGAGGRDAEVAVLQDRVDQLVRAFRVRGHRIARIDPLGLPVPPVQELDPAYYGIGEHDMDRPVSSVTIPDAGPLTVRELIEHLRNTYCRAIGVQYMHIDDLSARWWLRDRMEATQNRIQLGREEKLRILKRLTDAVIFETFIQAKYPGAKSFSLEGAESLIPLLDLAIEKAGAQGIDEIVMAMAHRGRLNVLANIVGKSPREIFREFEDVDPELHRGRGDVKYHLGHSTDWQTAAGRKVHISLCFNPSHLEFVNTVALGRMRAKQDRAGDLDRRRGMVLLIHGDAAFAGEGVVQETLNLSQLAAYRTGGTIHVIVNNQIGFTTPPEAYRSTRYATDVAKMLQSPIFHVNGEDPEAVAQVIRMAMEFRFEYQRDVVIDMYSYRKHGHNEGDEPSFTQPVLYRAIAATKPVGEGYLERLLASGGVTRDEADAMTSRRRGELEQELAAARSKAYRQEPQAPAGIWAGYHGGPAGEAEDAETGVPGERLSALLAATARLPADFHPHPKIERGLKLRREMASGARPLDWTAAEALAFATLATEGQRVRLSGQDTARGTFSQRHAVLHDFEDGHPYVPLQHLAAGQAPVEILDSPLSEAGVLGFEYGYSLDWPDGLILWEAQFGDFVNAGQVVIDQFIASAEDKWRRLSGLGLLLPHGFEGMGPEHSSARLDRFLALAAEDNIQVAQPTTPAQYFHLLRRQVLRRWRKPLVVMTPKSLLRHPQVVSPLADLARGRFQPVLADATAARGEEVRRILLVSGKLYYQLLAAREEEKRRDIALLRVEELHPFPQAALAAALAGYAEGTPAFWVEEEPENMGAWRYLRVTCGERLLGRHPLAGISRAASASPATGSASAHQLEQREIIARAFAR
jgi:2-oxoglutarate dehydrogenase E1 component